MIFHAPKYSSLGGMATDTDTLVGDFTSFSVPTGAINTTIDVPLTLGGVVPKVIWVWMIGRTDLVDAVGLRDVNFSYGYGISPTSRRVITNQSLNNSATSSTHSIFRSDSILVSISSGGAIDGRLDINSFTANNVQFIVDQQFSSAYTAFVLAIGGSSITNTSIVDVTKLLTTGDQDIITPGFTPNYIELLCIGGAGSLPQASINRFCIGRATTNPVANHLVCMLSRDALATTDTSSYANDVECFAVTNATNTAVSRASLTTGIDNGFRLNFSENNGAAIMFSVLSIKGTFNVSLGNFSSQTDTTTTVQSDLGFVPKAGMLWSHCKVESTLDTPQANAELSVGGYQGPLSGIAQGSVGFVDVDNISPSACGTSIRFFDDYVNIDTAGAIEGTGQLFAPTVPPSNALTHKMSDADPSQTFIMYSAFGPLTSTVTDQSALIQSGETMKVLGITCQNMGTTNATVQIYESDRTTIIQTIRVAANSTTTINVGFLAHRGMFVDPGSTTRVTVFHTNTL